MCPFVYAMHEHHNGAQYGNTQVELRAEDDH